MLSLRGQQQLWDQITDNQSVRQDPGPDLEGRISNSRQANKLNCRIKAQSVSVLSERERVCFAQLTGLTRLEASIQREAIIKYNTRMIFCTSPWKKRVRAALDLLVERFLNDEFVLLYFYRKLDVPKLLHCVRRTNLNILVIGRKFCWIFNASRPHRQHFVGTKH